MSEAAMDENPQATIEALRAEVATLRAVADVARRVVADARVTGRWAKATRDLHYALERVGSETNPHLCLPAWLFDARQHAAGPAYFLLAIKPGGGFPSTDGAHDSPAGVATARRLYEGIALVRPPEGTRYLMLTVQAAPEPGGAVNQEAIDNINRMAGER